MEEEKKGEQTLIEYRLDQIEKKLDEVTKILVQTQGQEFRIQTIETSLAELKTQKNKNIDRWLSPLVASIVAGVVSMIFMLVGIK